jgi:hypothetical protein
MAVLQREFIVGRRYRLANWLSNSSLRDRVIVYLGNYPDIQAAQNGGPSHLVQVVTEWGSLGEKYLVKHGVIERL